MFEVHLAEVFTIDEVASAAGIPREHAEALAASGQLRGVDGTSFVGTAEAIRVARLLRRSAASGLHITPSDLFEPVTPTLTRRARVPVAVSSALHASMLAAIVLLASLNVNSAVPQQQREEPARMVFLATPGPGGGGGGGGLKNPLPAPRIERKADRPSKALTVPTVTPRPAATTAKADPKPAQPAPPAAPVRPPDPATHEPEPLPSNVLVAPVVAMSNDTRDREGVIEHGQGDADSQGPGSGGGAGTGEGTGNGQGQGSGIGAGSGGGTGGGPYRPGSGIEPPRLLREVKADYTEEARRRGLTGEVVLEIVVRTDGSVGDVRVVRGLGSGLDQRAVDAVRQWRFEPARRKGSPVDVLVEVAVDFLLR